MCQHYEVHHTGALACTGEEMRLRAVFAPGVWRAVFSRASWENLEEARREADAE